MLHQVDIYSMGVIFFEMLHPFQTKSELIGYLEEISKYWSSNSNAKIHILDSFPHTMKITWPFEVCIFLDMILMR